MYVVNTIPVSSLQSFDYFVFPEQNVVNQDYFQKQVNNISNTLTEMGKSFMDTGKTIYESINNSEALRLAKAALKYIKGAVHPNQIVELVELDAIRAAQPVMQRYIMADIVARQMYHDLKIDGYSDTYVDNNPGKVGLEHYDYRRVTEDVIMDTTDTEGNYDWVARSFGEDLLHGDRDLLLEEKMDIFKTWNVLEFYMNVGSEDPTNPWGGVVS